MPQLPVAAAQPQPAPAPPPPIDLTPYALKSDLTDLESRLTGKISSAPDLSSLATKDDLLAHAGEVASKLATNQGLAERLQQDFQRGVDQLQQQQAAGTQSTGQAVVAAVKGVLDSRVSEAGGALSYGHIVAIGVAGLFGMTPLALAGLLATRGLSKAIAIRNSQSGSGGATQGQPFRD